MLLGKIQIKYSSIAILIIVVFSTTFYVFMGGNNLDYFQVLTMSLVTTILFCKFSIIKNEIPLYILILMMLISIVYTKIFNITSFIYSTFFIFTFIQYKHIINKKHLSINLYFKVIKYIIIAYGLVLVIQQVSRILGLPILNGLDFYTKNYRYNSLSNEPSHTSIIILALMVAYMYTKEIITKEKYTFKYVYKKDKLIWFIYLYILCTSGSATAFLVIPITFLFFVNLKNLIIFSILGGILVTLAVAYIDIPAFIRIRELVPILFSLDPEMISLVDQSASARINPILYYLQDFEISSIDTWFGKGCDYAEPMLMDRIVGENNEFKTGAGGVFPILFYDYGLISGICFLICLFKYTYSKHQPFFIVIWLAFFYSATFNSYLQWIYITLAYTTIYFYKKSRYEHYSIS